MMNPKEDMITLHTGWGSAEREHEVRIVNRRDIVEIFRKTDQHSNRSIVTIARWQHTKQLSVREDSDEILKLMEEGDPKE